MQLCDRVVKLDDRVVKQDSETGRPKTSTGTVRIRNKPKAWNWSVKSGGSGTHRNECSCALCIPAANGECSNAEIKLK